MSDRRAHPRFDVIGALWGVLELREEARLRNVSTTGVLLDSPVSMPIDSAQTIRLTVDGDDVAVEARVRHVRFDDEAGGLRYLIGLEFVDLPSPILESIEQLEGDDA